MPEGRGRDRQATEKELLAAVGRVLSRDITGIGINSVAREAGVDKVLIYRYFEGLDGLLAAFAASTAFWPGPEEILGTGPDDLRAMAVAERWSTGLVRYARALRDRPLAREVLAWELVARNEFTEVLRRRRESWFDDLLRHFPDEGDAIGGNRSSSALVIVSSIHYLLARSRLHPDFNGLDIASEDGWSRIEEIVRALSVGAVGGGRSECPRATAGNNHERTE